MWASESHWRHWHHQRGRKHRSWRSNTFEYSFSLLWIACLLVCVFRFSFLFFSISQSLRIITNNVVATKKWVRFDFSSTRLLCSLMFFHVFSFFLLPFALFALPLYFVCNYFLPFLRFASVLLCWPQFFVLFLYCRFLIPYPFDPFSIYFCLIIYHISCHLITIYQQYMM